MLILKRSSRLTCEHSTRLKKTKTHTSVLRQRCIEWIAQQGPCLCSCIVACECYVLLVGKACQVALVTIVCIGNVCISGRSFQFLVEKVRNINEPRCLLYFSIFRNTSCVCTCLRLLCLPATVLAECCQERTQRNSIPPS